MTTDERIDRLVERHEALAQTVELLTHDVQALVQEGRTRAERQDRLLDAMLEAIARLANTGAAHNKQLADHEERIGKIEDNS